jgi:cation:H+ antiporter
MQIGWAIVVFITCLIVIFFAADFVIDGIEELGEIWKVPTILLAYIFIGIDLEETVASWGSAINGLPDIAVGNVIGNTIISICFCFALPALFYEISFKKVQKWILPYILVFGIWIILYTLFPNMRILFGVLAIVTYIGFIILNLFAQKPLEISESLVDIKKEEEEEGKRNKSTKGWKITKAILLFLIGITALYFASEWLINSTQDILNSVNIQESVFGLIIIAAGTNVEEFMILFKSIKKKIPEIGLGALLGKIIWNIGPNFGISLLLLNSVTIVPLNLLINSILLFGIILPVFMFIVLKFKKLNWKSSIILLILFGGFLAITLLL